MAVGHGKEGVYDPTAVAAIAYYLVVPILLILFFLFESHRFLAMSREDSIQCNTRSGCETFGRKFTVYHGAFFCSSRFRSYGYSKVRLLESEAQLAIQDKTRDVQPLGRRFHTWRCRYCAYLGPLLCSSALYLNLTVFRPCPLKKVSSTAIIKFSLANHVSVRTAT